MSSWGWRADGEDMAKADLKQGSVDILMGYISKLSDVCAFYDNNREGAVFELASVLNELLISSQHTESEIDKIKRKDEAFDIDFITSCFPIPNTKPFTMGWHISDISNITIPRDTTYAGLIIKSLVKVKNANVLRFLHKAERFPHINKPINMNNWLREIVLSDMEQRSLSRKEIIIAVCHEGKQLPQGYEDLEEKTAYFKNTDLFKVFGISYETLSNPLYASIRQIAWEVLESFKEFGLSNKDSETTSDQINRNDFIARMTALEKQGISVPLSGEGDDFLKGILIYALKHANKYLYFYLPTVYQNVIGEFLDEFPASPLDIKGLFYKTILEKTDDAILRKMDNVRLVEVAKFPFVIYDDKYYAIEAADDSGRKIWVANQVSEENVKYLKSFFEELYK